VEGVANDRRQSLYTNERAPVSILQEPGGFSVLVSMDMENISATGFRKPNPLARSESKPKNCRLKTRGREFHLRDILHKTFCSLPSSNSLEQLSEQMKKVSGREGGMGMTVRVPGRSLIRRNSHWHAVRLFNRNTDGFLIQSFDRVTMCILGPNKKGTRRWERRDFSFCLKPLVLPAHGEIFFQTKWKFYVSEFSYICCYFI
jgi:hypothetical protein